MDHINWRLSLPKWTKSPFVCRTVEVTMARIGYTATRSEVLE